MKTLLALLAVLFTAGLSACKQQPAEAPAPVVQEQAAPAAPATETTETSNPAESEGAAPAAPAAPATK